MFSYVDLTVLPRKRKKRFQFYFYGYVSTRPIACVASVSVLFRSKEKPRNEILGFGHARNETRGKK